MEFDCKCDNGTCVADGNKTVCVCDPGFGKIGKTTCKGTCYSEIAAADLNLLVSDTQHSSSFESHSRALY
ncbi:hypothetical protein AVEN_139739-1 [Araneus ventricosus]|uniref:Uncharacterized protein n=1 Tax=Araneus ventricosus TaxID=182803 RepID=A0A4Y2M2G0_ARAVE|nr:hypothetical protein AVEN_139739-1 [Araneus ventricosus]